MKEQNKYCNIILRQFITELLEMYLFCPFYQDLFTPSCLKTENEANSNLYHKKSQTLILPIPTTMTYQIWTIRMTVGIDSANCNMRQPAVARAIRGSSIIPKGYDMLYRMPSSMRFFFMVNSVTVQENCNKLCINSDRVCSRCTVG